MNLLLRFSQCFLDGRAIPPISRYTANRKGAYHGYYDHYCYLPLYVFAGEQVLCARLWPSNIDPSAGSGKEIDRIVNRIHTRWPDLQIVLRSDSGFCREALMAWCEANAVAGAAGAAESR